MIVNKELMRIARLKKKPIAMMTGEEFIELTKIAHQEIERDKAVARTNQLMSDSNKLAKAYYGNFGNPTSRGFND